MRTDSGTRSSLALRQFSDRLQTLRNNDPIARRPSALPAVPVPGEAATVRGASTARPE